LLDLPGIIEGAKDGKGRGKQVIAGTNENIPSQENRISKKLSPVVFKLHVLAA
jgi:hypothetical protein